MYEAFFGLRERPFDLVPNPRFLYLTPRQQEAFSNLRYGLMVSRGMTLLLGEAGTGKTTLLKSVLAEIDTSSVECVLMSNPTLTRAEFYEFLTTGFKLSPDAANSKTRFLLELSRHLQERYESGGVSAIVLDEAQSLPYELLEEVRLLSNIDTEKVKLLNVVLAGQPELAARLNEPSLRQLKQRIGLRCELASLDFPETAAYIAGRLKIAGGEPAAIFSREAIQTIHAMSRGLPRTINVICENALIGGFAAHARPVSRSIVEDVCHDFDLGAVPPAPDEPLVNTRDAREPQAPAGAAPATPRPSPTAASRCSPKPGENAGSRFFEEAMPSRILTPTLVLSCLVTTAALGWSPALAAAQPPDPSAGAPVVADGIEPPADYVIGPEDVLGVLFWRETEMSGDVTVRPDGRITLPLIGDVVAAGLTPVALKANLQGVGSEVSHRPECDHRRAGDQEPPGVHHRRGDEPRRLSPHRSQDGDAADCAGRRGERVRGQERDRRDPRRERAAAPLQLQVRRRSAREEPAAEHPAQARRHRRGAVGTPCGRSGLVAMLPTLLIFSTVSSAQVLEAPPRPEPGRAGRRAALPRGLSPYTLRINFLGGFDDDHGGRCGRRPPALSGMQAFSDVTFGYTLQKPTRSLETSVRALAASSRDLSLAPRYGGEADVRGSINLGQRSELGVAADVRYDRYLSLGAWAGAGGGGGQIPSLPAANPTNSLTQQRALSTQTVATINRRWNRATTTEFLYSLFHPVASRQ